MLSNEATYRSFPRCLSRPRVLSVATFREFVCRRTGNSVLYLITTCFGNLLYCRPSYAATRAHQCMCQPAREICTRRYPTSLATRLFGSLGIWVENETGFLCLIAFDSPDFVQAAPHLVWNVMKQVVCVSSTSIHVLGCGPNTFVLVLSTLVNKR